MGATLGTIASIVGIGSGVKNLTRSGQQGGSSSSSTYVPTGLGQADQTWQQILQNAAQTAGQGNSQLNPALLSGLTQALGVDPSQFLAASQNAGNISSGLAPAALQGMGFLNNLAGTQAGAAGQLYGAGQNVYNTALDPQQALYNRLQQQITDASRAATSSRGIGMGPEAAGIENQALGNFNIDWQNQQLGRQLAGLQGMSGAYGQAGNQLQGAGRDVTGGLALGSLAPGLAQQGGALPYQAQLGAATQPFNVANQYGQAVGSMNNPQLAILQSIIPYINQGLGATGQAFGQQAQGAYGLGQSLNTFGQNAPSAWAALGNIFGPSTPPGYGYGSNYGQDNVSVGPPAPDPYGG